VVTQGETIQECQDRAREAIALHIEGLRTRGLPVPEEHTQPRLISVRVAA
jgi:predicted RNase H-like HicB family nuclease